jgi:2,3-dihydroxybenzoate-AMP ligase
MSSAPANIPTTDVASIVQHPLPGVVYPDAERLSRYLAAGDLAPISLVESLKRVLRTFADNVAIDGPDTRLTYAELDARSGAFAAGLRRLGFEQNDRILFQLENSAELIIALIGCWKAQLIPVCTLVPHRRAEIDPIGRLSEARGAIVQASLADFALEMRASLPALEHIIVARGEAPAGCISFSSIEQECRGSEHLVEVYDPFQVVIFQLSGGTTSVPKIIPRFGNEYFANMAMCAERYGMNMSDRVYVPLPLMHNAAMACLAFPALLSGATVLLAAQVDGPTVVKMLSHYRPTWMAIAGPMLARLKASGVLDQLDTSSLRSSISTNSARAADELLGGSNLHIFGMSEGLIMLPSPGDSAQLRHETVGYPISTADEVRLVEPGSEQDVEFGAIGELLVRGPYTIAGYYKAEERNAEAFTNDGFYRSGDLMRAVKIDGATLYTFEGRIKDVIDRASEKINAEEVERALKADPAVADAAVVGLHCPDYGERACAFLIPADPNEAPDLEQVRTSLEQVGLAKFKWPERIEIVADFPLTKANKLDKAELRRIGGAFRKDNAEGASQ